MSAKLIDDYIIESEENLRVAEAVVEALPAARQKLADGFLDKLDQQLKQNQPEWRSHHEHRQFLDKWASYHFWDPQWKEQYAVTLQFGEYGKWMVFGVSRRYDRIAGRPFCDELLKQIKTSRLFAKAEAHDWWEARIPLEYPRPDWSGAEMLWRMQADKGVLAHVTGLLLDVAEISKPILDRWVMQHQITSGSPINSTQT